MKSKVFRRWKIIRDFSIGWTLGFVFMSIIRGVGTIEEGAVQFELWKSILVAFTFGPAFGSIAGIAQIVMEERYYQRVPIYKLTLYRFLYSVAFLFVLVGLSYLMVIFLFGISINFFVFLIEPGSAAIYTYILVLDFFLVILRQVNLMLGEGNLLKVLRGKFYTPREEERIFMFLDLQASTSLAEKLGHIQYSKLLQDCFNDLGIVVDYRAEVYQYVGDEVILSWSFKNGLKNNNCLASFFMFKAVLLEKKAYYVQNYGVLPFFKAGLHAGTVTVTEVGKYKKEIAYHGDTINTAARIQGVCNQYEKEFLVSNFLKEQLETSGFEFETIGQVPLKGKGKEVLVHAVSEIE